jgi:hypothetical protein
VKNLERENSKFTCSCAPLPHELILNRNREIKIKIRDEIQSFHIDENDEFE